MKKQLFNGLALVFFLHLLLTSEAYCRNFTRITLKEASCGDGRPYSFFISHGDPKKVAIEFMGGGVCWDAGSCYGPKLRTWVHPIPRLPAYSALSLKGAHFGNWTYIYFPYCTGDVFAGKHTAYYPVLKGSDTLHLQVRHHGAWNIEQAIEHLLFFQQERVAWKKLEHLTVMGASAGAIGALMHARLLAQSFAHRDATKQQLILDSPGLHWNPTFWDRFSQWMRWDFERALLPLGVDRELTDTSPISQFVPAICRTLQAWQVAFLQADQDIVMARLFGEMSLKEHAAVVYGPLGLPAQAKKTTNCQAWIPKGPWHTFFIAPPTLEVRDPAGVSAKKFIQEFVK